VVCSPAYNIHAARGLMAQPDHTLPYISPQAVQVMVLQPLCLPPPSPVWPGCGHLHQLAICLGLDQAVHVVVARVVPHLGAS
jgi:hypothetical protein